MSTMLDLNLLPVARQAGQEYPELMGLYVADAPRRAARGRATDRLILYLAMIGNAPLPPARQDQLLADLAKLYYATPGSATAALRAVAENLNDVLLKRNLRLASSGHQGMAIFTQAVLREQQLYLAHSGPGHSFLITTSETQHFYDAEMAERSLGQSRVTPVCFFQTSLQANDTLILAARPAPDWDETTLGGLHGQGPESLRRRLTGAALLDLNAVLVQARPGQGQFLVMRSRTAVATEQPPIQVGEDQIARSAPQAAAPVVSADVVSAGAAAALANILASQDGEIVGQVSEQEHVAASLGEAEPPAPSRLEPSPAEPPPAQRPKFSLAPLGKLLVMIGTPLALLLRKLAHLMRTLLGRMMPVDPFEAVPNSAMAFIAIVVPVVIMTIGVTVYFELGQDAQYELLYAQALKTAEQAAGQTELLAQRADWEKTLLVLQQAESYRKLSPEAQTLRAQARSAVDGLDLIRRVNYQPAIINQLPANVNVMNMVVSDADIYLLDSNSGSVLHAQLTNQGYELDPSFECGPNVSGISLAGPLIDIVSWPAGYKPSASVVAVDAGGNVIYCQPNQSPVIEKFALPPNALLDNIRGITLDLGDLYVLDPFANAVWVYWKSNINDQPTLYFDADVPPMDDVIDMAVDKDKLYLLHIDGRMTICDYSSLGVAPTRCADQAYVDSRPGRENTPLNTPDVFSQILITEPPEPSLYLLGPDLQTIYHFSLRSLVFQRQYLPQKALAARGATAFAINPVRRQIFLATGNLVYYAILP